MQIYYSIPIYVFALVVLLDSSLTLLHCSVDFHCSEHVKIQASKRISYSQSQMGRSEKDALMSAVAGGGDAQSNNSFFYSNQAPSVLTESLLHPQHSISEGSDREDSDRDSGFSSKDLNQNK